MGKKKGLPKDDLHKTPKNQLKTITYKTPRYLDTTFYAYYFRDLAHIILSVIYSAVNSNELVKYIF